MPKKEIEFTDSQTEFEWRAIEGDSGGLAEKILSIDSETGNVTRLLRFPKGFQGRDVLRHPFWEEIYILEGYLIDVKEKQTYPKGYYACRPAGMIHGPFQAPEGCISFEMRYVDPRLTKDPFTFHFVLKSGENCLPLEFKMARMVNGGYVGRNQGEVRHHIEELAKQGIPGPSSTPTLYPVSRRMLSQSSSIEVFGEETSGEAEFVLLMENEKQIYVGVGSDHTDRKLEIVDIAWSKNICPNVISKELWSFEDILPHWDKIVLRSWVTKAGIRSLYQEAPLRSILPPQELISFVRSRVQGGLDRTVIFSGTIGILKGELVFGEKFEVELNDPATGDQLSVSYDLTPLNFMKSF
jgi:hypothetical protein